MGRFNKVRGVGRKDKENQALRDRIAELEDALARKCGDEPGDAPTSDAMPKAKKRSRHYTHYDLRKLAYDYYEFMGGDVIDNEDVGAERPVGASSGCSATPGRRAPLGLLALGLLGLVRRRR